LLRLRVREEDARMERQPSGTVTLVFTDIEGSTQLLEELGVDAYRVALGEHRRVVREACAGYSGYEVDYEGDAFFYAFSSAQDAVGAASAFMVGLQDGPIRVRVGIHTGQPALDPPKYVGLDVHRAARLMASAHGGQVVVSRETVGLLPDGVFVLRDLGDHRFKDLGPPERVYQLLVDGLPQEFPRLKSLYHVSLPVPATPFLGRETELADVVARLLDPDMRLLTLTGPGGTGKTRLALHAAAEVGDHFPDGVWWVALAPLRDPALAVPSLQRVLELPEQPGVAPVELIAKALLGKKTLVLLDNAEHLLPALADDLATLTAACPTLRLLVTSRERLQLAAESTWPVPTLARVDAVALFVQRASAAGVAVEGDAAVAEVCARLDFLPLAIELAAARVRSLSVVAILERLDERLGLLTSRARDVDERHRTLRATIEWSYGLLGPEEQRVYRAMSVFAGGCTLEAAEEVTGTDLDLLESLLDKSLVRHRLEDDGADRYWLLETLREFAAEQLEAMGEHEEVRAAHAEWYAAFATPPDGDVWSAPVERVNALQRELDNMRVAHEWLVSHAETKRVLEMAIDMWTVWEMRDLLAEGDAWLARSLALPGAERTVARAQCLQGRAILAYFLGDMGASKAFGDEGVAIMRDVGTDEQLAHALLAASWARRHHDVAAARALLDEALMLARRIGTPHILRTTLHNLGELERNVGNFDEGAAHLEEALAYARDLGDPAWVGAIAHSLADLELRRDHLDRALELYLQAAETVTAAEFTSHIGVCVGGLAAVAALRGDEALARRLWGAVEHWERERGASIPPDYRALYVAAMVGLTADGGPPLALEEAIELVRSSASPSAHRAD
jgi:predicted ATPase/class 3 adenylate cyclase